MQQSGQITLEDSLNQLPGFTPSGNAGTGGQGAGGRATLNLRGLGSNRNLVLLDGRRLPLSDINGNVDINILPESIIGSVDVITGGASAIYGSDAMSGVVNFKTDKYFDGVRAPTSRMATAFAAIMASSTHRWRWAPNLPTIAAG
ncbi:TonB-dependent receptor plug domain-containing protein [Sphingobium rhizovicinum]|uniref:TonB-dependent receptor plug domain-containing protein n=1 Tax=Sphingobium rhizovicinum TaxID=432308 RepID=A0ABV7NQN5_9SPHN